MHTSCDMCFLVVEDDEPKLNAVIATLREIDDATTILTAASVASAIDLLTKHRVDFAVIDMSLPAFDIASDVNGGGRPHGFGGRDIIRFLENEQAGSKAVVLTQYEEFNLNVSYGRSQNLHSISEELTAEFEGVLLAVIYYSGRRGDWREKLKQLISDIREGNC